MKKKYPPLTRTVTFERNGKTYYGSYTVDDDYVTVTYGMARKTAQIHRPLYSPEAVATLLLSEMVSPEKKGF